MSDAIDESSAHLPIVSPEERRIIDQAHAVYQSGLGGTSHQTVRKMVAALAALYPEKKGTTDEDAQLRLASYERLLADIPHDILGRAFNASAKTYQFFPTVAEIRKLALHELTERQMRALACRKLIMKHDREYQPPREAEPLKPEEVPEANALMKKLNLATRYRPDGTPFQLQPGDADPCEAEAVGEAAE